MQVAFMRPLIKNLNYMAEIKPMALIESMKRDRPGELPRTEERPRWRKNHEGLLLENLWC